MDEHDNLFSCNILSEGFIEHDQKINFQKIKVNLAGLWVSIHWGVDGRNECICVWIMMLYINYM